MPPKAAKEPEEAVEPAPAELPEVDLDSLPDTPSGLALKKVGVDGDGEEYAKEKARHRWGHD